MNVTWRRNISQTFQIIVSFFGLILVFFILMMLPVYLIRAVKEINFPDLIKSVPTDEEMISILYIISTILSFVILIFNIYNNKKRYNRYWIDHIPEIVFHEYLKKCKPDLIEIKSVNDRQFYSGIIISLLCDEKFNIYHLVSLMDYRGYTINIKTNTMDNIVDLFIPFNGFPWSEINYKKINIGFSCRRVSDQTDFINITCKGLDAFYK